MEVKPNTGILFKNERKTEERHPDYTGTWVDERGQECYLDAWKNESKNGKAYLKLRVGKQKAEAAPVKTAYKPKQYEESDVPF